MKQHYFVLATALSLSSVVSLAQAVPPRSLTGSVLTDTGEGLPGATIFIKGTYLAVPTNSLGQFVITVPATQAFPLVIATSYIGYETQYDTLTSADAPLRIVLAPSQTLVNEVVVSASRREERALQAPVTVDKLNAAAVARLTQVDLIQGLARQKGVDITTSGVFNASLSTRGFNGSNSERLVQFVDYMDTQSPSLNINAGNSLGLPEVDIASVEVLSGSSSALYGANAFNGVVLTTSKDPFLYEGLNVRLRGGNRDYVDGQLRYAVKLGRRFAFKLTGSYARALEWIADSDAPFDLRYVPNNNAQGSPLGYDALNRYGDVSNTFGPTGGALNGKTVFMPGWTERELIAGDNHGVLYRVVPSLHFLVTDKIKLLAEFKRASGTTGYQLTNRYRFKNFASNQARVELRSENWFVRAYQTQDFGNDTYDLPFTGSFMQTAVDPRSGAANLSYAQQYFGAYARAYNTYLARNPGDVAGAGQAGLGAGAPVQLPAGSPEFATLRQQVISDPTSGIGSRVNPNSLLSDLSAQYEFRQRFADIVLGGAYREFRLGSNGQLFADRDGKRIRNNEYGAYAQVQSKSLVADHLKLTAAARVDRSKNFKAVFSPRASAVYSIDDAHLHNLRVSYNQAYRSPTQQGQYLSLDLRRVLLVGNISNGFAGYGMPVATELGTILRAGAGAPELLAPYEVSTDRLRPERVATVETGYKAQLTDQLSVDAAYYFSRYRDFIGQVRLISNVDGSRPTLAQLGAAAANLAPFQTPDQTTRVIQVQANATQEVRASGGLVALTYAVSPALNLTGNYSLNVLNENNLPDNFQSYFNTPKHKYNVGAYGAIKQFSYSTNYRWAQSYLFESPFAAGTLRSIQSLDGQLNYTFPKLGTSVQVGGSNLTNARNVQIYGGPQVGRLVYLGLNLELK
ncbi:carboxypeptidase-like regulatory domain-containing protein [Hymenobacter sp. YC55]|uniref:TonB-dependent receptor n=1 Tax=Hymenobacter sp. YC55 TaxID=3034019 RepID=UPI0023F877A3|nr:carboxypeptidase-like regulatory domain-containing protein [Hymenobacter sp. YC55]MDF7815360.1 carboxypeptidase-like regulatory domain-containing protein [Hymenobacter sp. YC55]